MLSVILLAAGFLAFILAKLKLFPKGNWMDIGFALAAAAAIIQLAFPR